MACINAGIAGRIAGGAIFQQRVLDDGGNATSVPVHRSVVVGSSSVVAEGQVGIAAFGRP